MVWSSQQLRSVEKDVELGDVLDARRYLRCSVGKKLVFKLLISLDPFECRRAELGVELGIIDRIVETVALV